MAGDRRPCDQCGGACIAGAASCLAHAGPEERAAALKQFSASGDLDLSSVTISDALLKEIFDAAPHNADGHLVFSAFQLVGATFEGDARFDKATFNGDAEFDGAAFNGSAGFARATFKGDAGFAEVTFENDPEFAEATFEGNAWFADVTFEGYARFARATFKGFARFVGATFNSYAWFDRATFKGDAEFDGAAFNGSAGFARAAFEGDAEFDGATFNGDAGFGEATFEGNVPALGPVVVEGKLDLDGVHFTSAVRIDADASALTCRRARFGGGVRLDIRRATIRLDESDFSVPSLFTGPAAGSSVGVAGRPRLLSLNGTNVAGLALGNVSLADCRFAGAHNLDKLRLEADAVFGLSPVIAEWERRQVIAEEAAYRAASARPGRWQAPLWPDDPEDQPAPLSPGVIAGLYRALRKGREDAKDEPGAADFYYGEMEMRRHDRGIGADRGRGRASRLVLAAYWLVSGYGLRAWRSLVTLALVTAFFALAFHFIGFAKPPEPATYWTSLLYAFRSTVSLTDDQVTLTAWGSFLQALLRIAGPVLLGLTLLALRNRVKR
jgi:Pentapeptide repeats (9 copies)